MLGLEGAALAECVEAAENDVIGFAAKLSRLCNQPSQILALHSPAGSRAKLQEDAVRKD